MNMVRATLRIEGRVQGVFFRQSTREMAAGRGLTGWVRNCVDGSVEAVFEGERQDVLAAVEWCRQGPPAATVSSVQVEWHAFQDEFESFSLHY